MILLKSIIFIGNLLNCDNIRNQSTNTAFYFQNEYRFDSEVTKLLLNRLFLRRLLQCAIIIIAVSKYPILFDLQIYQGTRKAFAKHEHIFDAGQISIYHFEKPQE